MKYEEEQEHEHKPSFTFTHVLLLSIFITTISLNKVKELGKNSLETSKKLAEIERQYLRKLDFYTDTENVCKKANEKLQEYYKTGDASLIGLDNSTRSQSTATYIKALTDIIADKAGGSTRRRLQSDPGSDGAGGTEDTDSDSGDNSNITENLKKYLMHVIPVLAFFVIAVLSIPGWVVCCTCCCSNCCCCCCCKRPICRFPFFIVTMTFNAMVFAVCIYGLTQSNKVFVGFANVECSLLKFIGEVTDGQTKQETPKWGGFNGIKSLLNGIPKKLNELGQGTIDNLTAKQGDINNAKVKFEGQKTTFFETNIDKNAPAKVFDDKTYWLLTYEISGAVDATSTNTFKYYLEQEYKLKVEEASKYIDDTVNNFKTVISDNSADIQKIVDDATKSLESIETPINDVKNMVADTIINYSDMIDEKGKLGFKLVYSVLTIVVAVNAALVVVYFVFGTTSCLRCRILRCLNKVFIHIFWNILALLMIITFIVGAVLTLVGTLGNDLVSVVSYFISVDNLNATDSQPLLIGGAAEYLTTCLIGDGDLSSVLKFDNNTAAQSLTSLQNLTAKIDETAAEFDKIRNSDAVNMYNTDIGKNIEYQKGTFIQMVAICQKGSGVTNCDELNDLLDKINDETNQNWSLSCPNGGSTECKDATRTTISSDCSSCSETVKSWAAKADFIISSLKYVKEGNDTTVDTTTFEGLSEELGELNDTYSKLVEKERDILPEFKNTIRNLTSIFDDYIGENGSIFDFLNCKFIGNNIDIVLKYLKEAVGSNIYTVGIFLLVAGCSMVFSIIFTILEVIIINAAVDDKLKSGVSGVSKFV